MEDTVGLKLEESSSSLLLDASAKKSIAIRVSATSYLVVLFLATFFTAFFIYLGFDVAAGILFVSSWLLIPFLIFNDKIVLIGGRLARTGLIPRIWSKINNTKLTIDIDDIEQVETHAMRAVKSGGSIFYRYETLVRGGGIQFSISSGSDDYRLMIQKLFPYLSENILDNRSVELRDYLRSTKDILLRAEQANIPSADFLESTGWASPGGDLKVSIRDREAQPKDIEKSNDLRQIANELRLSGHLTQSLEAFRRALMINPRNGWLIYEFARCLHSFAGVDHNPKLERKALAALRLAEKRARSDEELMLRVGECYFQFGDWKRARTAFTNAIAMTGENFRSIRGLAEIALREGKIAHVIHHFSTASRLAETPALRRWTRAETEYFTRLLDDFDYMDLEISRVNYLDNLERGKRTALKIALLGVPWIIIGIFFEETLIVNLGWAVSTVSLLIWAGMIVSKNILSSRVPMEIE